MMHSTVSHRVQNYFIYYKNKIKKKANKAPDYERSAFHQPFLMFLQTTPPPPPHPVTMSAQNNYHYKIILRLENIYFTPNHIFPFSFQRLLSFRLILLGFWTVHHLVHRTEEHITSKTGSFHPQEYLFIWVRQPVRLALCNETKTVITPHILPDNENIQCTKHRVPCSVWNITTVGEVQIPNDKFTNQLQHTTVTTI
jgi:hypothetical protein